MNEQLAECSAFARLLFTGLWCLADREGRLEDRPKKIKAQVFPYDDVDGDALLSELAAQDLIIRYEVDGLRYIAIPTFLKHQSPHRNETESNIPPVPNFDQCLTKEQPRKEASTTKAGSSTDQNPLELELELEPKLEHETDSICVPNGTRADKPKKIPLICPVEQIVKAYSDILPGLLPVQRITDTRRKAIAARWREDKERQTLSWWNDYFERVRASDFLMGRCPPTQGRATAWQADFDWLLKPANLQKVVEGKYDNHTRAAPHLSYEEAARKFSFLGIRLDEEPEAVEVQAEEAFI